MRTLVTPLLLLLIIGAFCVSTPRVLADEAKQPEPQGDVEAVKPREFTEEETKAADELRRTYSNEQQTLVNALRFLLRPEFEDDLMIGRRYRPCVLDPFEKESEASLTLLEELRLWAVLQSGMASTGVTDRQLSRFFATPLPRENLNLARYGVEMLLCRTIFKLPKLNAADEAKTRADNILEAVAQLKDATSDRSSLIQGNVVRVQWYANQMWMSLMMRAALDLGCEIDDHLWEVALKNLCNADVRDRGFVSTKDARNPSGDLHPNLMALTALGLANNAPTGVIGRSAARAVEKQVKEVPELLARLKTDYEKESWGGARMLLVQSLPEDFAPERDTAAAWRGNILRVAVSEPDPTGAVFLRSTMANDMGLNGIGWTRAESVTCETILTCLALSGGLYDCVPAPLATVELASVGRLMYAFAVLHATHTRADGGDFESRVSIAIEDGCDFLARSQKEDGSFPGVSKGTPGNSAICLLAMLHGGISRDAPSIQNGLGWLREYCAQGSGGSTYSIALILMFLQKYYEPEERETGIIEADNENDHAKARRAMWGKLQKDDAEIVATFVKTLDASNVGGQRGGWTYGPVGRNGFGSSDNSCSQFAMLGYKAASLLGAEIKPSVFENEAARLIRQYSEDKNLEKVEYIHSPDDREGNDDERKSKSTRSEWKGVIYPGGWGYTCGDMNYRTLDLTAAGISSLTICMDELKVRGELSRPMAQKLGLTIRGAEAWMAHDFYPTERLTGEYSQLVVSQGDGIGIYYGLYSIERGCVLAGIRKLNDELDWYRTGADALIEAQNMNGSWGRLPAVEGSNWESQPQMVNTSMAILFLKMAAPPVITEHKKREQERLEREKAKNPVTSGPNDKKQDGDKEPEAGK